MPFILYYIRGGHLQPWIQYGAVNSPFVSLASAPIAASLFLVFIRYLMTLCIRPINIFSAERESGAVIGKASLYSESCLYVSDLATIFLNVLFRPEIS
jgi:hypothetical protein